MGRAALGEMIGQGQYARYLEETTEWTKARFGKSLTPAQVDAYRRFTKLPMGNLLQKDGNGSASIGSFRMDFEPQEESSDRRAMAREMIKMMVGDRAQQMQKAGLTSATGFNFYDLRGPAYLIYPVNVPFRNSLARMGRVNDGYGTAAHWKATRDFGSPYAGALEGQRVAIGTPNEVDYTATYKEIGGERAATFTSQFAGEGYTDNVADEHLRGLHSLWLQEEALMLLGNSGTASGNNGYALGTANTPTAALVTATGSIPDATKVSCFVVELSALANPQNAQYGYGLFPTAAGGLTPSYIRQNADGSQTPVNGGIGAMSAASAVVTTDSTHEQVKFTVTPKNGAYAWAWFVNLVDSSAPALGNSILAAITTVPTFTFNAATQAGTQLANAAGLNVDHSFNVTDFDGLLTYSASTAGAYYKNLLGANLTSGHNGSVDEIDNALLNLWQNYQAQASCIWCSADSKLALTRTVLASGTNPNAFRFEYVRDSQNNLLGGFVLSAYQSQFSMSPNGGTALPVRIHPMLPPGTIFFDVETNPYPQSRIPFVRGMLVQRDYYSIEWPLVSRQWTFGTYTHEVLAHNIPWISAVITGIGGAGS